MKTKLVITTVVISAIVVSITILLNSMKLEEPKERIFMGNYSINGNTTNINGKSFFVSKSYVTDAYQNQTIQFHDVIFKFTSGSTPYAPGSSGGIMLNFLDGHNETIPVGHYTSLPITLFSNHLKPQAGFTENQNRTLNLLVETN